MKAMEQKLTNEEIAKVFAMYLPKDGIRCYDEGKPNIDKDDCGYVISRLLGEKPVEDSICGSLEAKLELHPLSKISDEDAIEVAKMTDVIAKGCKAIVEREKDRIIVYDRYNDTVYTASRCNVVNLCLDTDYDVWYHDDESRVQSLDMCRLSFIHQYLISQSYAVPLFFAPNHWANGLTAIELGIAIEHEPK